MSEESTGRRSSYVDARGRTIPLVEDPTVLAVKLKPGKGALSAQARSFVEEEGEFATAIPRYGIKLYQANARDPRVTALRRDPAVAFAGPVYRRSPTSREVVVVLRRFHVRFKPDVTSEEIDALNAEQGVTIVEQLDVAPNTFVLEGSGPENGLGLARRYRESDLVAWTEPELIQRRATKAQVATPRSSSAVQATTSGEAAADVERGARAGAYVARQWHLDKANVKKAWTITKGNDTVRIAILDDGVDVGHPEFKGKIEKLKQFDFSAGTADASPKSASDKHGTACAGVATAAGAKAIGVAPWCRLMPIRTPDFSSGADEAKMFLWAADNGADVISCSWGPPDDGTEWPLPEVVRLAFAEITRKGGRGRKGYGIPIFFAAGNGDEDVMADGYASSEHVMAIAACTSKDTKSWYSDYGDAICVCAPSNGDPADGEKSILTTDRRGDSGYNPDPDGEETLTDKNYTSTFGGTSSACPLVAGVAALMLTVNKKLTPWQVGECMRRTAVKIGSEEDYDEHGHSQIFGYGKIDAYAAVRMAKHNPPAEPAEPETPAEPEAGAQPARTPPYIVACVPSVSRSGPPPAFQVDPAPNTRYAVEIATSPELFDAAGHGDERDFCVNFFATWDQRAPVPRMMSDPRYTLPANAWAGMRGAARLYYRALTCTPTASAPWGNYRPTIADGDAADTPDRVPYVEVVAARLARVAPPRNARPTIEGPDVYDPSLPPPTFSVTPGAATFYAVEVATDAGLFENEADRAPGTFYGSWSRGLLPAPRVGEGTVTYTLPAPVWKRMRRAKRIFYRAITTSADDRDLAQIQSSVAPGAKPPAIELAAQRASTALRTARVVAPATSRVSDEDNWRARHTERSAPGSARSTSGGTADPTRSAAARGTSTRTPPAAGIGEVGPIPANGTAARESTGDYPGSLRFVQARFYRKFTPTASQPQRKITHIVIHITDGPQRTALGVASYFQNPHDARGNPVSASAHYVIGQQGEVVQCVRDRDVAFHAHAASNYSIGIEHCANTRGMGHTPVQYASSAALVRWLCDRYSVPIDRVHVLGHAEADRATSHTRCPTGAGWRWKEYMNMVTEAVSRPIA